MSKKPKGVRRSYSDEFKQDAVDLVVKQGYTFKAAADAVGVNVNSLRSWHEKLVPEPESCDDSSTVEELTAENKRLRKQLQRAEMEREILKKATAYFAKESR